MSACLWWEFLMILHNINILLQVFFCVLIGAFSLGNAAPNLQNLGTARGAAYAVYNLIDRVRIYEHLVSPHSSIYTSKLHSDWIGIHFPQVPVIDNQSEEGLKPGSLTGEVEFRNVKFRYPAREEVQVNDKAKLKNNTQFSKRTLQFPLESWWKHNWFYYILTKCRFWRELTWK